MALVEPKNPAAPVVEPTTPAKPSATDKDGDGIPDAILEIPALQAVVAGQPAAVSASIEAFSKRPEGKAIAEHKDKLFKAGINLYRSLAGDVGVIFNQLYLAPEDLQAADKAGKLLEIAPPFDQVGEQVAKSGENHPALLSQGPPRAAKTPDIQTPPQGAAMPQPSTAAQRRMAEQRVKNLAPQSPTKEANPGQGKLLNSIMKPVI